MKRNLPKLPNKVLSSLSSCLSLPFSVLLSLFFFLSYFLSFFLTFFFFLSFYLSFFLSFFLSLNQSPHCARNVLESRSCVDTIPKKSINFVTFFMSETDTLSPWRSSKIDHSLPNTQPQKINIVLTRCVGVQRVQLFPQLAAKVVLHNGVGLVCGDEVFSRQVVGELGAL